MNMLHRRRAKLMLICFGILSALLLYRFAEVQFFYAHADAIARAKQSQVNLFYPQPRRADILDRNGEPLAVSVETFALYASQSGFLKSNAAAEREHLLAYLRERGRLRNDATVQLQDATKTTVRLADHLTPNEAGYVRGLNLEGIWLDPYYTRYYPASEVAAQLVGFVDKDNKGIEGLELLYDAQLRGQSGTKQLLRDGRGRPIKVLSVQSEMNEGSTLQLSVDLQLQYMAYHHLLNGIQTSRASSGNLITLDIHTGEVYAMVQYPSFNPNNRKQLDVNAVRNRALTDVFEPGSTLKPLILSGVLEQKQFSNSYQVDTSPGHIRRGDLIIRDDRDLRKLSIDQVIARSSNVGMVKLAEQVEPRLLLRTLYKLGLGRRTGSMFPGEREGYLPLKPLSVSGEATLAYGYGLSVTSMQLAKAYGVLGNGGNDFYVNFVKTADEDKMQVIGADIATRVLEGLKLAVSPYGTAAAAAVDGYALAGKTGTAQKSSSGGGYSQDEYLAIFVGLAPADAPRFVTLVILDGTHGPNYYSGQTAAPVFAAYMKDLFRIYAMAPRRASL